MRDDYYDAMSYYNFFKKEKEDTYVEYESALDEYKRKKMSEEKITQYWIDLLRIDTLSTDSLIEEFEEHKNVFLIYTDNLHRNNGKKYLFKLKNIFDLHNDKVYYVELERLFSEDRSDSIWKKNISANGKSGFVSLRKFISSYGIQNLENVLLKKYYEEIKKIWKTDEKTVKWAKLSYGDPSDFVKDGKVATIGKTKGDKMNKAIDKVMVKNTSAAKVAARISAGRAVNAVVMEKVKPQLPMLARGYAEHPLAAVVVANLVSMGVDMMASDNDKARYVAGAMLEAAMTDFLGKFDLEKLLKDVLSAADVEVPVEGE